MPIVIREDSMKEIPPVPHWNARDGELWWLGHCIKMFKKGAEAQRALLDVFEASGWPRTIKDPLSLGYAKNRKVRLHNTVQNLNRGLAEHSIRYRMDGTSKGVRWEVDT